MVGHVMCSSGGRSVAEMLISGSGVLKGGIGRRYLLRQSVVIEVSSTRIKRLRLKEVRVAFKMESPRWGLGSCSYSCSKRSLPLAGPLKSRDRALIGGPGGPDRQGAT